MSILRLLSEEVFDFSAEQMTSTKTKNLKTTMCAEFSSIFQLCSEVLNSATQASLIKATLETLLRFFNWIPLGYIFETPIIDTLRTRFLEIPEFRNVTLMCLTEIGGLQTGQQNAYDEKLVQMFTEVLTTISKIIPLSLDLKTTYSSSNSRDQEFIQNLALFLCNFFSVHLSVGLSITIKSHAFTNLYDSLLKTYRTETSSLMRTSTLSESRKSTTGRSSRSA
jgi:exportin-1